MTNRKSYVVFGAAALVLLGAAGVLLRRALEPDVAHIHSARSAEASQTAGAPASNAPPAEVTTPPARDDASVVGALAAPESAAPSASSRAEAPPPSRGSEAPTAGKAAKQQRPPASPARSEPPRPKPPKDSALTDFGGRLY